MDSPRPNLDIRCPADETAGGRASAGWRSGCRMANFAGAMNAIELLRRQHREIERLFAQAKQGARVGELLDEPLAIKQLMADLIACDPADPQFDVRLDLLEAQVRQHVAEEETKLF